MKRRVLALLATVLLSVPARLVAQAAVNDPAPALTFKDVTTGEAISLAALKGKVVVVDFWATWCGPCRMEIPGYVEMYKKYGKDGLVIIGVSVDQAGPKVVKRFIEANAMNYPVVMGGSDAIDAFGGIEAIPTTFLINREGKIVHRKVGAMESAEYEALVKKAL
jgi:thiol-disulfide isomerase/thioredoxin